MRQGFIKVAALTPKVKVADTTYNREQICMLIDEGFGFCLVDHVLCDDADEKDVHPIYL